MTVRHHDPAAEANAKLGGSLNALVLEPSPPADHNEPFFADDPTAVPSGATRTVGPTSAAHRTWADVVAERPELSSWAAERWLAAYRPLKPVPAGYPDARNAYHRLAYAVVAETRRCANTKFGLRSPASARLWVPNPTHADPAANGGVASAGVGAVWCRCPRLRSLFA